MTLNELRLESFRNYGDCSFTFDPGVNLILGDNAQGKTNLLEAIAFLGSGKSFRPLCPAGRKGIFTGAGTEPKVGAVFRK